MPVDESVPSYPWKTKPFAHQKDWWERSRDVPACAILWEQGTGKTKLTLDTAAWLFLAGRIEALVVVAPNGVHRNWIADEVPIHLPDEVPRHPLLWQSNKANTQKAKRAAKEALDGKGLLILAISYEGVMTKVGDSFFTKLLRSRRTLLVLDESARIKTPGRKRTTRILARGKAASYRRILTGTPVDNSPFDVYAQFKFLNPTIWDELGCRTYSAFKNYFGVWIDLHDPRSGRAFKNLIKYKNLAKLRDITKRWGTRVTKDEVLDLPPKLYSKRYFDLTAEQNGWYTEMENTFSILHEAGEVTATLAIVQLTRFQQIVSGFVVDDEQRVILAEQNPRLALLREVLGDLQGKAIIWAKFRLEIDLIMKALKDDGVEAVRYDGATTAEERADAIEQFQRGSARAFVANPAAAGEGLTLHAASSVVYYSNSYKLKDRLQSEDRAHRIGQTKSVTYYDLLASGTIDERIVTALRNKQDVAAVITGDKLREWI